MGIKYTSIFMLVLPTFLFAQNKLKIGQWKSHLPYNSGLSLTQSNEEVYYSTRSAIVRFDKKDFSIKTYAKEDGLYEIGPSVISYNLGSQSVVIGYENGLISLLKEDGVTTFTDIFDFNNIPIDKKINQLYNISESTVLIAANYGLTELDFKREKFNFTLFTNPLIVNDALVYGSNYVMATTGGVYVFDANSNRVIQDINQWTRLDIDTLLPSDAEAFTLANYKDTLYIGIDSSIYTWAGDTAALFFRKKGYNCIHISTGGWRLVATLECIDGCNAEVIEFAGDTIYYGPSLCVERTLKAEADQYGRIWYADMYSKFRTSTKIDYGCDRIYVNSPVTANASQMAIARDNTLVVATGGKDETWTPTWKQDGFYTYTNGFWGRVSPFENTILDSILGYDLLAVTTHPETGDFYLGSFLSGLIIYDKEGKITHYDYKNSSLRGVPGDESRTRVSGLVFDDKNNLWISNFSAPKPLSVFTADGQWKSFTMPNSGGVFSDIAVDKNNNKWIVVPDRDKSRGLIVFNEGDLEDDSDDRMRIISRGNSELSTNDVNAVTVDREGDVWVGTTEGVIVFECPDVFDGECKGSRRKVDQDGITGYLLRYENVLSIAVDGANRKWFGTTNGVYVQSPSGEEEVASFTVDNSPLLDNSVHDIVINPRTGEVFFATAKGISSYRSEAIEGNDFFDEKVTVFPNPVRPEYDGPIAIRGLVTDAVIKIVDVEGRLVYESKALGGQAIWDGTDYNGKKAASGVYYVFASKVKEFERPQGAVAKILLVR